MKCELHDQSRGPRETGVGSMIQRGFCKLQTLNFILTVAADTAEACTSVWQCSTHRSFGTNPVSQMNP